METMGKWRPWWNQTEYVIQKVLMRAIQKNVLLIEFEPLCQKLWAFMSNLS